MKILLTGGMGYIGSHTAITLALAGHEIHIYDNLSNSHIDILEKIKRISGKTAGFTNGDIRDTKKLTSTLQENTIEAVIHLAGLKAVGESSKIPVEYYSNNVQGSISLLQAMQAAKVFTLVFSSSATVYGDPVYLPYDEAHPTVPTNPYGQNKLQVEQLLHDVANSDESWHIACLRYFNPVGAHDSGLIGENPKGIPNNLMPVIGQVLTGKLPQLNIYGDDYDTPDGTGKRDYIHVMDLAEGHLAALEWLHENKGCHIFNLGSATSFSVLELLQCFEKISGKVIPYQVVERRPGDLPEYYAAAGKAEAILKWKAKRGLESICQTAWKWIKNAPLN